MQEGKTYLRTYIPQSEQTNRLKTYLFCILTGTDIHDLYSAFKANNEQQYYWPHIICDAKEPKDFYGDDGKRIRRSLQAVFDEAKTFRGHGTMDDMENLHHKLVFLLDSDYEHKRSRKFVDNLLKRKKEWLFSFAMDPCIEKTNKMAVGC